MKRCPYKEPLDPISLIRQVGDQNDYLNYHPSDFRKTIESTQDLQEEEASPEEEVFPEGEASPEEEDTQEEEEYHLEDHQEAVGDHHRCQ